jgi:hypothetical protein
MTTHRPAKSLREIRSLCHPRPLRGGELDTLYVETDQGRDPDSHVRQTLRSLLEDDPAVQRILLYGHRGCGKSTELARLTADLGAGWLPVTFSVLEELPPVGVRAEEVLLAIALRLVKAATDDPPLAATALQTDDRLKSIADWFRTIRKSTQTGRDAQLTTQAGAEVSTGGWLFGLGKLFTEFSSELKFRGITETSIVEEVRKRPGDLVLQINRLVASIQDALGPSGRRLLIIVEDLDKLSIADARSVFIENGQLLSGINAHIIYTIPIFTFYSPDANALKAMFDHDLSLPMIKVADPIGEPAHGLEIIREIVHRRIDPGSITDEALKHLILQTGGVLRHVFEVLQTVATMTSLREPPIRKEHIDYGLGRLRTEIGTQIALPQHIQVQGLENVEQLYERLRDCARKCREGKPCPPTGDTIVQILLQSCALVEYNGQRWLGVHPLVTQYLNDVGYPV